MSGVGQGTRRVQRQGMAMFSAANAVAQAAALLRYMLLARLLGPEQLGLAAILILTAQFFEAVTDGGLDRFLVQSIAGNRGSANQMVHLVLIGRGLTIAAAICLLSGLVARLYHDPALRDGLMLLAIAPAIAGFAHLDYRRVQRHHRFGPEGRIIMASELVGLTVTVTTAVLARSFVAVAAGLIARAATVVLVSHIVAQRPYRAGFSRAHLPAMAAFGMPLMLNGVLIFLGGQGDRLFIGNSLGARELGWYSAIILLIFYPATMVARLVQSISLPVIAGARGDTAARLKASQQLAGHTALLAAAMAIGFAMLAPLAVPLIYGASFRQPAMLIALIGILQATRFVRLAPATLALATGHSRVVLWNGIARLIAFPAAYVLQRSLGNLSGIVVAFTVAELMALGLMAVLLDRKGLGLPRRDGRRLLLLTVLFVGIPAVPDGWVGGSLVEFISGMVAVLLGAAMLAFTERESLKTLRQRVKTVVRRRLLSVAQVSR